MENNFVDYPASIFSFGSLAMSVVASFIFCGYGYYLIKRMKKPNRVELKILMVVLLVAMVRVFLPVNLGITHTINTEGFLNVFTAPLCKYIGNVENEIQVYKVISWAAVGITILLLLVKGVKYLSFRSQLYLLSSENVALSKQLEGLLRDEEKGKITIRKMDTACSPFVTGLQNICIVFPNISYPEESLDLLLQHELEHIRNKDLYLLFFVEVFACVFWWNPVVYLIAREMHAVLEITDDVKLTNNLPYEKKIGYCDCLLYTAKCVKNNTPRYSLPFAQPEAMLLKKRVQVILEKGDYKPKGFLYALCNIVLVASLAIGSFLFVVEAIDLEVPPELYEEGMISFSMENAYLVKYDDYYNLYSDGEYIGQVTSLEDPFDELDVYEPVTVELETEK